MKFFMAKKAEISEKELKMKALLDKIESLLDNINSTNKEAKMEEFREMEIHKKFEDPEDSKEFISKAADLIFEKALQHPEHSKFYTDLCRIQVDQELAKATKHSEFRNQILSRVQNIFDTKESKDVEVKATGNKEKISQLDLMKFKKSQLNNVIFIGNLYQNRILSDKIIIWCLFDLMNHTYPDKNGVYPEPPYNEDYLIMASHLLLESQLKWNLPDYCEQTHQHLEKIAEKCSDKARVVILKNLGVSVDETETEADDLKKKKSWLKALFSCGF